MARERTSGQRKESYRNIRYEYEYEVQGTAVRQTAIPVEYPEPEQQPQPQRRKRVDRQTQKNRQRAKAFNLPTMAAISILMVVTAVSCMKYVGMQGELNSHLKAVKNLNNTLEDATAKNDAKLLEVEASIDFTEVYRKAIEELGMYYPGKDQVLWFQSTESEYVSQYENIPMD